MSDHPMDQRFKPDGFEHSAILELQAYWAQLWNTEQPSGLPIGDNLQRILQALRNQRFGFDKCKAAIRGQYKLASQDGNQNWREFFHVFPELRSGGRRHSNKLDLDRFEGYVRNGTKRQPADVAKTNAEHEQARAELEARENAKVADDLKESNGKITKDALRQIMQKAKNEAAK